MQAANPKIFISHSWKDKSLVRQLEDKLVAAGAEVWIDHRRIRGGDNLPKRISDALGWCNTLLLVWSKSASRSRWVELEWTNAISLNKEILPCLLDATKLPEILTNKAYIEFSDEEQGFPQILRALKLDQSLNLPPHVKEEKRFSKSHHKVITMLAILLLMFSLLIVTSVNKNIVSCAPQNSNKLLLASSPPVNEETEYTLSNRSLGNSPSYKNYDAYFTVTPFKGKFSQNEKLNIVLILNTKFNREGEIKVIWLKLDAIEKTIKSKTYEFRTGENRLPLIFDVPKRSYFIKVGFIGKLRNSDTEIFTYFQKQILVD